MSCMRIMWTVFVTFPEVADKVGKKAEYACTWARALADQLLIFIFFQMRRR